jgi:hypothetical protein
MDVERIIDDIGQLEEMFEAPDIRPLSANDISAANRRHDEMLAHSPWFRIWHHYGVCCRGEAEGGPRAIAAFPVSKPIAMLAFRAGVAPAEVQRLSRRTVSPIEEEAFQEGDIATCILARV